MNTLTKSKNHKAFYGDHEFLLIDKNLYKADLSADFDTNGNRECRWQCTQEKAIELPKTFPFMQPKDDWEERVYNAPIAGPKAPTLFMSPIPGVGYISIA